MNVQNSVGQVVLCNAAGEPVGVSRIQIDDILYVKGPRGLIKVKVTALNPLSSVSVP